MAELSFDSGVLIALGRRDTAAWAWMRRATERGVAPIVSTAAVAEVWRDGRQRWLRSALRGCQIVPVDERTAKTAGIACGATGAATLDALIAATAALRGGALLTADASDMTSLREHFRALRLLVL